ncbi:MAG TPA: pyridoxamine 5'-phosphate oxidase [Pseudomonadales bacterium]|nr:pyridoxamine 5'-phosphate oxidase [Pseudomonadales bacterium]
MNPADIRRDYSAGAMDRTDLDANPLKQFQKWFDYAVAKLSSGDVNAMVLATADKAGKPSSRTVLLKGVDERGFIFFTNYDSRKGRELAENPNAALTFFWQTLERQVCVAGTVSKVSAAESEAYFKSRPRDSRLAAWASNQSDTIPDRATLEKKWNEMSAKFPGEIPLPPNWGGYVLKPERVEFWQGRPGRLHDRFSYTRQPDNSWKLDRLAP